MARFASNPSAILSRMRAAAMVAMLAAIGLAGCAQQPQQLAAAGHPKEYFPSSVYGHVSPRVVADGQPIPRGGGQYLVGKPYTVAGQTYYPSERRVTQVGLASWYGDAFHGRLTANGEVYDRDSFTAAHPTMPLPSYARVTNLRNNSSMIVRVNDRGPYHSNRIMDVSRRVADALDIRRTGTAKVKVEWVARASLAGSDDAKLAATLRTDGPARLDGIAETTQVAAAPSLAPARVASLGAFYPTHARRDGVEDADSDASPSAGHRERFRDAEADENDRTSTIARHRDAIRPSHVAEMRPAKGHRVEAPKIGERVAHRDGIASAAPTLRHAAVSHAMPPAKPAHLAMLLPPPRPHLGSIKAPRSHAR